MGMLIDCVCTAYQSAIHEIKKSLNNKFFIICVLLCVYQGNYSYTIASQRQDSVIEDKVIELYKEYGGVLNC